MMQASCAQLMSINDHMDEVQMIELFYSMEKVLEAKVAAHREQGTAKVSEVHLVYCVHVIAQSQRHVLATKKELGALFQAMPRDLQQTLLSAPHRASLLQVCVATHTCCYKHVCTHRTCTSRRARCLEWLDGVRIEHCRD